MASFIVATPPSRSSRPRAGVFMPMTPMRFATVPGSRCSMNEARCRSAALRAMRIMSNG